ncbi:SacI like domain [Trypanosoma vivax]|nr:SacI like domain [Trypanosoma vivax]
MQLSKAPPRKRFALAVKNGVQILLLVLPRPHKPPPPSELEPLLFFDSAPQQDQTQSISQSKGKGINKWAEGSFVIPLVVNPNGELRRCRDLPKEEFQDLREAHRLCGPFECFTEYPAIFGALLLDKLYFLVAVTVEDVATLPFGGAILRVTKSEWIPVDIPEAAQLELSQQDRSKLREFQCYQFEKGYYYSDDYDLRLPFPFTTPDAGLAPEFHCDWTMELRRPFCLEGVEESCSVLIRGYAEGREVFLKDKTTVHVLLCGRQNNHNPGPRYHGRGLNDVNAVGNDHVYEYVIWKQVDSKCVHFARHTILRGTIPVRWSTQVNKTAAEPSMIFSADREEVLRGCEQYFGFVMAQLTSLIRYDSGGGGALSGAPRLRCINMLRHTAKSDEETLMKHYTGAVDRSAVAVRQQFPNSELVLSHVDWLNLSREQGIDVATRSFWEVVLSFFSGAGLDTLVTVGLMNLDGSVTRKMVQTSFVRVNCADSLDRTNIGCFYTCFQATVFMLTALGVETHSFADQRPLPPLDEQCDQGRGASSRAQSPNMRVRESPFGVLLSTWKEARNPAVYPAAIGRILAELHVYNGDTVAQLYTSSAAMHANILRGICGAKAGASNMVIATQRRYENVFEDEKKNRNIELLLGRNITAHFPSLSRAFLTRPVPLDRWCCTLTASDLPAGVQSSDIDHALRKAWDDSVVPHLHRHGAHQIPSSALIFSVTVRGNGTGDRSKSPTAASKSSPNNFKKSPVGSNAEAGVDTFNMAVIEFDPDLCHQLDVPTFLQQFSLPKLGAHILTLSPYSYPLLSSGNGQSRSLLEKAGSSLRSGLKNFVRGLNA